MRSLTVFSVSINDISLNNLYKFLFDSSDLAYNDFLSIIQKMYINTDLYNTGIKADST